LIRYVLLSVLKGPAKQHVVEKGICMRKLIIPLVVMTLSLVLVPAAMATGKQAQTYQVTLTDLNDSGVSGSAILTVDGDQLTVTLNVTGVEPDQMHMQHIHGLDHKSSVCPPASAAGADGLLSLADGLPFYGPVKLPLTPYPMPDSASYQFTQTYSLADANGDITPLQSQSIVVHGLTVDGTYDATVPVACGQIRVTPGGA
jgi:hypothetical protein